MPFMKKFDFAIFDLDGTLLDTRDGVISAAKYAMKQYGFEVPDQKTLESLIGPPMQVSFQNLYALADNEAMEMANVFRDAYQTDELLFRASPYNGMSLIDAGIKIGIATYKREDYAKRLLIKKGFDAYTNYMYGSDFAGQLKKSDIIKICLDEMGCRDYTKAVYIGDGISDGKGANSVGMAFLPVTYGFGFVSANDTREYKPIGVAGSCLEIKEVLGC